MKTEPSKICLQSENFKIYLYLNLCLNFTHIYRPVKNILNGYFSIHVYSEMDHTCLNLIGHVFILIEAHEPLKYNWSTSRQTFALMISLHGCTYIYTGGIHLQDEQIC